MNVRIHEVRRGYSAGRKLTLILPIRLESDEATRVDAAAIRDVVKNREPSLPS